MFSKKIKKITWDTTLDPIDYPEKIKKKFFSLTLINKKKLINWIGLVSKKFKNDLNWWVSMPASRDPYKSQLFRNIIITEILKEKKINRYLDCLILDSKSFEKTLINNKIFDFNKIKIIVKKKKFNSSILKSLTYNFIVFFLIKLFIKPNKLKTNQKINIFDTYSDHRELKYSSAYHILKKNLKKNFKQLYFVPTFIINNNLKSLIKNIFFISEKNYILKESYISLREFIIVFFQSILKKKNNHQFIHFKNTDYSKLINEELASRKEFYSEFQSRLNFLFVKKLNLNNIKIKKIIIRFENQATDKAWSLAIKNFFPKTIIVGYQDFMYYPQLPHQSPTYFEEKGQVLPNYLVVTGKIFKKPRLEFYKNKKILIGPTLNNQKIFKLKIKRKYNFKFVLALSGIKKLDIKMCDWIFFVLSKNKNLKVAIKPHPTLPLSSFIKRLPENLNKQIFISQNNAYKLLEETEILISSGPTGISLESLLFGCKVFYLNLDPNDYLIIKKISKIKSHITFISDEHELQSKMELFNEINYKKKKNNLVNLFYTKINKHNIRIFN